MMEINDMKKDCSAGLGGSFRKVFSVLGMAAGIIGGAYLLLKLAESGAESTPAEDEDDDFVDEKISFE